MAKILVTGGTGFIGGYCIKQLLQEGYKVITTVRSDEKGALLLKSHSSYAKGNLSYQIVKDIAQDGAFDETIKSTPDLEYVMHTASPFHYNVQDPVKDFLEPAITGTTSILKAIKEYAPSVKRVVLTSSFAAMRDGSDQEPPFYDESSWNPITWEEAVADKKATYRGSKALAEKAAWSFIETERPRFDLIAINPTLVFGPAAPHLTPDENPNLAESLNTSNLRILEMLQGKMRTSLQPTGFYSWVDVRDVADAHVKALKLPSNTTTNQQQRFFLIADYHTNKQIANIIAGYQNGMLKDRLPADIEDQDDDFPPVGQRYTFDNRKSRDVLGVEYRSLKTCVEDTVGSFLQLGAID